MLQAIGPDGERAPTASPGDSASSSSCSSSAPARRLQRQISDAWTRGDREGVDRAIACGMNFYAAMALVQVAALLAVAYLALPHSKLQPELVSAGRSSCSGSRRSRPRASASRWSISSVLQAARRYDFVPRFELADHDPAVRVLVVGLSRDTTSSGSSWPRRRAGRPGARPGPLGDGPRAGPRRRISAGRGGPTTRRWCTSASTCR